MVRFVSVLNDWIDDRGMEPIDCEELIKMPLESTGEWFAEKWNMWLRDMIEQRLPVSLLFDLFVFRSDFWHQISDNSLV